MTDNERLRGWLDAAVDGAYCAGAEQERAAVVAHLRERAIHGAGNIVSVEDACTILADLFERGEHRREEAVCAHGNTECRRCGIGPGCGEHRSEREPLEDDSIEYRDIGKED